MLHKKENVIPLRPHHGMCLAYFEGNGYSEGFVGHMQEMLDIFQQNAVIKLTVDTDEICSACPNNQNGTCEDLQKVEGFDRAVLELCGLSEQQVLEFQDFAKVVEQKILSKGKRVQICGNCQWDALCAGKASRWKEMDF